MLKRKKVHPLLQFIVVVVVGGLRQVLFFTLCAVKGFLWFRVLMRKDEGHPDMSRKKNSTENNRPAGHRGA